MTPTQLKPASLSPACGHKEKLLLLHSLKCTEIRETRKSKVSHSCKRVDREELRDFRFYLIIQCIRLQQIPPTVRHFRCIVPLN